MSDKGVASSTPDDADKTSTRASHVYPRELPATGYVRLPTVLNVFPVGKSTWWKGIKEGRFPAGVKLGPRAIAWRVEDIRALIERTAQGGAAA